MSRFNDEFNRTQEFVLKTDLSKEHNAIVEKCLEFSTGVSKHSAILGTPDKLMKTAQEMKFSESSILGIESALQTGLQFADPETPVWGNWTAGTLNLLIQEIGSSVDSQTLLNMAFPDKAVAEYLVLLDRIAPNSGMLPEFGGASSVLPTARPLDTYGLQYQPGLWAARTMLNAKDIVYARKRGMGTFEDRGIGQLIAYNTVNLVTQALTRKKYLLNQAIFNNGFSYAGATINSNIPSGNYVAMYESIGVLNADGSCTYSSADPLYNPFIAINNILMNPIFLKYRHYIRGVMVNGADLQVIMNHPSIKGVTNTLLMDSLEVRIGDAVKQMNSYYAPGFNFRLLADDDVWLGQNADGTANNAEQNFFVPRGSMYVVLDLTSAGGQAGAFHLTYNEVDPNVDNPAQGLFTGVFNRNLQNSDTTNRIDIVAALSGAPAIYMPEAQFVLTGLYSNV